MTALSDSIFSHIQNWTAGRYTERHGIVSSYDPKNHLAKVTFQPEGQESGWLPIETGHIGSGYGMVFGLQPGQAGVSNSGQGGQTGETQNQGDQVVVRFQEGDIESGKIAQRVHSDMDKPPEVQSGEMMIWAKFQKSGAGTPDGASGGQGGTGQQIYLKNDGSVAITDGNGATYTMDGNGSVKVKCKNLEYDCSGTVTINGNVINLVGNVHLGSSGGQPASLKGTTDDAGHADVGNLATKVWVT
jgi:hypothetical protein